ncbi:MAG TPA: dipeptide epimerase [Terriglobales bacterium]|nr:dipeptide epimerase [Terriglobales bacterium]
MEVTRKGFMKGFAGALFAGGFLGRATEMLAQAQQTSNSHPRQTRIADVTVWPFTMQQKETLRIALGNMGADNVLVRLRTNDGVVGWGESSPFSPVMGETQASDLTMSKHLADIVKGRDPFTIPKIVLDMEAFVPGHPGIKAAFEMALWDIAGKLSNQPVCCMLGSFRDSTLTDKTVFLDTPEVMAQKAKKITDMGFKVVKVKLGEAPEYDFKRLSAVRASIGPSIGIRIDANQAWNAATAVRALKLLEPLNVEFCEQPVPHWDWDGLKYVRDHSPIAIMADECIHTPHDAIEAVRRDCCDMINIKVMKSGGILNSMRIAQIADAANMKCMFGCMSEIKVAITAAAHVLMASPNAVYADLDSFTEYDADPVIGGVLLKDGSLSIAEKPGLGLDIDAAWLKGLRSI